MSASRGLRARLVVGLTATPERLDGKGLGEFFDRIIEPTTVRELIEREYLCEYRYFAPYVPDMDGIKKIGGDSGWYAYDWLWKLRGFIDLLLGGVGVRRGRPHPSSLTVGDAVDFWRVETYEPDHLLRLAAEMKVPGRAWLEFEVLPEGSGSTIRQTAVFDPRGLNGLIYWYALYPIHGAVFSGMLRGIAKAAARVATRTPLPISVGSS